jgi:hypothetical protein
MRHRLTGAAKSRVRIAKVFPQPSVIFKYSLFKYGTEKLRHSSDEHGQESQNQILPTLQVITVKQLHAELPGN